jgi:hypothetical protein
VPENYKMVKAVGRVSCYYGNLSGTEEDNDLVVSFSISDAHLFVLYLSSARLAGDLAFDISFVNRCLKVSFCLKRFVRKVSSIYKPCVERESAQITGQLIKFFMGVLTCAKEDQLFHAFGAVDDRFIRENYRTNF